MADRGPEVTDQVGGRAASPPDVVPVGAQGSGDLVPRPRAEPEPGNQDNRCGVHSPNLGSATDIRVRDGGQTVMAAPWPSCAEMVSSSNHIPPSAR